MEKLLKIDEMAAVLGVSRPKAYELTKSAGFPVTRIGRALRVSPRLLDEWVAEQAGKGKLDTTDRGGEINYVN
jgi:excisionase family DNA binding protein